MHLALPKATRAVTQFLSMQNDTCTPQEQLGSLTLLSLIDTTNINADCL